MDRRRNQRAGEPRVRMLDLQPREGRTAVRAAGLAAAPYPGAVDMGRTHSVLPTALGPCGAADVWRSPAMGPVAEPMTSIVRACAFASKRRALRSSARHRVGRRSLHG